MHGLVVSSLQSWGYWSWSSYTRLDWRIVPNPEVLVDYYRGLVGRTEDYILESDVDSGHAMQVDPAQDEAQASNTARNSSDMTDTLSG